MSEPTELDGVEKIKLASHYLRTPIAEELVDGNDYFGAESIQLLKHHGSYQQDDRDARTERRKQKLDKLYSMMVRTKIPGGKLTSQQLLAELDLCDELGNSTLRITTRQGLQLHGIPKKSIRETIQRINSCGLSTLGACGDVNRNVMSTPAPYKNAVYEQLQATAEQLAAYFAPRSSSYREVWLTDTETGEKEQVGGQQHDMDTSLDGDAVEPIYGKRYLPRKFKMGIATSDDNCVDLYSQDIGWMAIVENNELIGFNVLVGGGFGVTPSAEKTFVAVAQKLCFVPPEEVQPLAEAIIKLQRDHGNRQDRKIARLKYVVAGWGMEKFKQTVEQYYGRPLAEPQPIDVSGYDDHMGWHEQGDGRWFYGLNVENGRILDDDQKQLKSALREICETLRPEIRLTPHQSILFADIETESKPRLEAILRRHHVTLTEEFSAVRRWSMACPAMPMCGLAVTESERVLPSMMDELEATLTELGLQDEIFTVRMTGCPNGCARPYNSDIGLVGRTLDKYTIFLGGRVFGDRLNFEYMDKVPTVEVVPTLAPVLAYYKEARENGESFGDFCHRKGRDDLLARCTAATE